MDDKNVIRFCQLILEFKKVHKTQINNEFSTVRFLDTNHTIYRNPTLDLLEILKTLKCIY